MTAKFRTAAEGVEIELEEAALAKVAQEFRESLRPFGLNLDKVMLTDTPERIFTMPDGRVLAEFRTMLLPVWYPQKLNELAAAGFEVVTVTRKYKKHPPQLMYYVRSVQEVLGGNYGNQ